jgi:hypothetical protein
MNYWIIGLVATVLWVEPGFGQDLEPAPALGQGAASLPGPQILSFSPSPASDQGQAPPPVLGRNPNSDTGPVQEKVTDFDTESAQVRWQDNRWQILTGGVCLKDFGRREAEAREVLRLIRALSLNQRGTVGTPQPVMEYWLSSGQAPQAFMAGLRVQPVELASVRAEAMEKQWCVRDAQRVLFLFGTHREEAQTAAEIIRRHGFTQIGYVGQPVPSMIYFLGGPPGTTRGRSMGSSVSMFSRTAHHARHPALKASRDDVGPAGSSNAALPPQQSLPFQEGKSSAEGRDQEKAMAAAAVPAVPQLATVVPLFADQPALGDRVAFDCRQLQLRLDGGTWKLCSGSYTIADFGPNLPEARRALDFLQFYRCNEHCLVGQPTLLFSFFLCAGQAPRGVAFGLAGRAFRPDQLTVRRDGQGWSIGDEHQTLISFGNAEAEARQLLRYIQLLKFDFLAPIASTSPQSLTLLVRTQ